MVQIIQEQERERRPSFTQKLNVGVGRGLEMANQLMQQKELQQQMKQANATYKQLTGEDLSGLRPEDQAKVAAQLLQNQGKQQRLGQIQSFLSRIYGKQPQEREDINVTEEGMTSQGPEVAQERMSFDPSQLTDADIAQATALDPNLGREFRNAKNSALEQKRHEEAIRTSKEKEYFKLNEPKIMELAEKERNLQMEGARYERLGELFSDPSKFPSSFTAALFTKDGNLNDIVYSQLTPQAQEAIKLIVDSTSNIKDTYGARVTNFDLQTYLKKLPSLLNTPEGKERVLRDLLIMNKLNQLHAQGIMEVFDEAGGTDKIPYSTAEKRYKKKYGDEEKSLRDLFVHGEKETFKEFPDPYKYLGRKVKDPETGEIFISDGQEWKPFKG